MYYVAIQQKFKYAIVLQLKDSSIRHQQPVEDI